MKFANKCPECGGNVQTKSIRKSIGLGFVNIPVAQFCLNPTCDWYQDFSDAKKPEELEETILQVKIPVSKDRMAEIKKRTPLIIKENMTVVKGAIVVIVLSLLLVFLLHFLQPQPPQPEAPKNIPVITTQPTSVAAALTPAVMPAVSRKYPVKLDVTHGFSPRFVIINTSDIVLWNNEENQRPRVGLISKDNLFKDRLMEHSDKYQYQFNQSGNYTFALADYDPVAHTFNEYPNDTGNVIVK